MRKGKIAKTIGLAGLVGLLNFNEVNAEEKFSLSAGLGGYIPSSDVVALKGIPYGFEIEGDYGNNKIGFRAGGSWFTKIGNRRAEFSSLSKRIVEGEQERAELVRFHGGLRFGNPWFYAGIGGVAVEGKDIFESADDKFLRTELRQFVESKNKQGFYVEGSIGGTYGKSKKAGFFLKGTYDHFSDKDKSSGIKFSAGVTFSP